MAKEENGKGYEAGGMAFVGSIIVGTGLGLLFKRPDIGAILGVGVGFLVMAIVRTVVK